MKSSSLSSWLTTVAAPTAHVAYVHNIGVCGYDTVEYAAFLKVVYRIQAGQALWSQIANIAA
jgi:hypothetical protein